MVTQEKKLNKINSGQGPSGLIGPKICIKSNNCISMQLAN